MNHFNLFPLLILLGLLVTQCATERKIPITPNVEVIKLPSQSTVPGETYKIIATGEASPKAIESGKINMMRATSCEAAKTLAMSKMSEIQTTTTIANSAIQIQDEILLEQGRFCQRTYLFKTNP